MTARRCSRSTGVSWRVWLRTNPRARADTLVVRMDIDERAFLLEDAPDTYYVTDYYSKYPVVLARLSKFNHDAVDDLLARSRALALEKAPRVRRPSRAATR